MTSAIIADDEPHLARHLETKLRLLWPELDIVQVLENGVDAADAIARLEPDLAFLDIQMPGLSGIEVAQGIEGRTRAACATCAPRAAERSIILRWTRCCFSRPTINTRWCAPPPTNT